MTYDEIIQKTHNEILKPYKVVWIPTNYRLPGYYNIVLVTVDGSVRTGSLNHYSYDDDDWTICDDYCVNLDRVTAWAPLPKPYERRDDDKRSAEKGI